jgi:hypothetical protein
VNRRKDTQRLYTLAALQFEKALRLSSVATAPSVVSPDLTCLVLTFSDLPLLLLPGWRARTGEDKRSFLNFSSVYLELK